MSEVTDRYGTEPRLVNNRYELGAGIGYGGMAEVYRGRDVRMGRDVAIKVLRSDLARDPNFLKRFEREARSAAALEHPQIVRVYDTGEGVINGVNLPYIVMEFVEGRTLREKLQREGPFDEREAMRITADICAALDYSHHRGIVHRDIKPANVMLTATGAVKVMDFGIAKANNATSSTMTGTQAVIGTAQYLSPEQAQGHKVDGRSDIYSTGVLFYELITGEPPFRGDNPVAVAYQHVREMPEPPSRQNPQVSPAADAIALKALEKEPDDRYATAGEMQDDLLAALAGRRVRAQAPSGRTGGYGATQVVRGAYQEPGYRNSGGYTRYQDAGHQDTGYQPTSRFQGGGFERGYDDGGGYDDGYTDEFDRFGPATGTTDRYGGGAGAGGPATPPARGNNAWKWVLGALAVVLTFVVVSLIATSLLKGNTGEGNETAKKVTIPTVIGQPFDTVKNRLVDLGFDPNNITRTEEKVPDATKVDSVLAIDPAEGTEVDDPKTQKVTLNVGVAADAVTIPNVVGQTEASARAQLEALGLQTTTQTYTDPTSLRAGTVAKTDPAVGNTAPQGGTVTLYIVSSQVTVPDLIGRNVDAATAELTRLGLNAQVQQEPSANKAPGTVIDQSPRNATVNKGETVTLFVAAQTTPTASATPSATSSPSGGGITLPGHTPSASPTQSTGGGGDGSGGGGGGNDGGGGGDGSGNG